MTATLVAPWIPPAASLNRTKMRDVAGAKAIGALAVTKTEKVRGTPWSICTGDTVGPRGETQFPPESV